ncbi:pyridoxamine 5'-phosphate oxidase family protein [Comamonas antarctica]|nr:pyridoxamine 5'-phosphate oxidase family protein [Comamonas antarctica]
MLQGIPHLFRPMLTPDILESSRRSVLCWLATADAHGCPNVSPKEIFAVFDDRHLVIANIASPCSAANIAANPQVCVSFVDVFAQKGFKLTGSARDIAADAPEFAHWAAPVLEKAGPRFALRSVFVVRARSAAPILAPSYWLYPQETTLQSQIEGAYRSYGVRGPVD